MNTSTEALERKTMPNKAMEAGSELDARLCRLLEPEYRASPVSVLVSSPDTVHKSTLGFWRRGSKGWQPIPVSVEWRATDKAAVKLGDMGYTITIRRPAFDPWKVWIVELKYEWSAGRWPWSEGRWGWKSGFFHGSKLPHVFTLVAVEALEKRAEATP